MALSKFEIVCAVIGIAVGVLIVIMYILSVAKAIRDRHRLRQKIRERRQGAGEGADKKGGRQPFNIIIVHDGVREERIRRGQPPPRTVVFSKRSLALKVQHRKSIPSKGTCVDPAARPSAPPLRPQRLQAPSPTVDFSVDSGLLGSATDMDSSGFSLGHSLDNASTLVNRSLDNASTLVNRSLDSRLSPAGANISNSAVSGGGRRGSNVITVRPYSSLPLPGLCRHVRSTCSPNPVSLTLCHPLCGPSGLCRQSCSPRDTGFRSGIFQQAPASPSQSSGSHTDH